MGVGPELLESDVHSKYEPVIENVSGRLQI